MCVWYVCVCLRDPLPLSAMPIITLHYLRKMESVTLDLFLSWSKCPLFYYLTPHLLWQMSGCRIIWKTFRLENLSGNIWWEPHKELSDKLNKGTTKKKKKEKKIVMSAIRITVLITSVFRLIVFLWGLCLLIMESTDRRSNSNYFLDWGQNPCI